MSPREAVKETLRFLFKCLEEDHGLSFSKEQIETAVEMLHDDDDFLDSLIDFFRERIEMFGGELGLWKEVAEDEP